ncbi:MGMT family protein [Arthrobacter sp. CAN_A1]|uniref:MGMT family protein n=1 Tax=Arthrobacter sp. CAN_A1 TaxID=2787717 RepID=UPI0018CA7FFB
MREDFAEAVYEVAGLIPSGLVLSYGDIAEILEWSGPRQVGAAMSLAGDRTPWWRVVRASGLPPAGLSVRAAPFYDAEETPRRTTGHTPNGTFPEDGYTIDMGAARWNPTAAQRVALDGIRSRLAGVSWLPGTMSEPHDGLEA